MQSLDTALFMIWGVLMVADDFCGNIKAMFAIKQTDCKNICMFFFIFLGFQFFFFNGLLVASPATRIIK